MKNLSTISILLAFNLMVQAQFKLETKAHLKSLTVYNSSAEMQYVKKVALQKGKNKITITGLTPYIVQNTIKVNVLEKSAKILTVTERLSFLKYIPRSQNTELQEKLEFNDNELGLINSQIEVLEMEKALLFKGEAIGGVSHGVAVSEIEKASTFFNKRYSKLSLDLFRLKKQKTNLKSDNTRIEKQLAQSSKGKSFTTSEVTVVLTSETATTVTLNLLLLTNDAGWAPMYDIKYTGLDNDLKMVFRANVFNATNVNWRNVKLKLSTATPTLGFRVPKLNNKNDEKDERKNLRYKNQNIEFKTIEASNIISNYDIDFEYTIPSDGKPYLVDVEHYTLPSNYRYIIIPKLDNHGFLKADISNWSSYNLISGTTNIYNNGTFLGKTFLETITQNDTLSIYLGKDNKIETFRSDIIQIKTNKIVGNYYVDKTSVDITIKNNNSHEIKVMVVDQVPVFKSHEKAKLSIANIDDAHYCSHEGMLSWKFSIPANHSKDLNFNYTIKSPKEGNGGYAIKPKRRKFRSLSSPAF